MSNFFVPCDGGVYHLQVSTFGNVKNISLINKDGSVMQDRDIAFEFSNVMSYAEDCLPLWHEIYSSLNRKTKKKVYFSFNVEVPYNGKTFDKWLISLDVKADGSGWYISKSFNNEDLTEDYLLQIFLRNFNGSLAEKEYLKKITSKGPSAK